MKDTEKLELFANCPVWKAVIKLAVPTVIGQIILVVYNMADTFFIGLTGSDAMITAVTVCMPAFMFLSAISNLFGVGGASVIARALGAGDNDRAQNTAAFAFWGCVSVTLLYSVAAACASGALRGIRCAGEHRCGDGRRSEYRAGSAVYVRDSP